MTFVATPAPGAMFVNWTGACSGTGDGVVTPIPTAGVTCTANFRNLWARSFHTSDSTGARGVVETNNALRYLACAGDDGCTAVVWNANKLTGAVIANTAFRLSEEFSLMRGVDILRDGANGTVVAVDTDDAGGPGLIWLGATNQVVRAFSYKTDGPIYHQPQKVLRNEAGGLSIAQYTYTFSDVDVLPAELVRVGSTGAVVGGTGFREALGDCAAPELAPTFYPAAMAQNDAGSYLVASSVNDGLDFVYRLNLTLFDQSGVPQWSRRVDASDLTLGVSAEDIVARGNDFFVMGSMNDAAGSVDAFVLSISATGTINWWKSAGNDGLEESANEAILRGTDLIVVGQSDQEGSSDFSALVWAGDGSTASGWLYGGAGFDRGASLSAASGGGYNLFGGTVDSFGNADNASWALRVDQDLQLVLETGSVIPYEPALRSQALNNVRVGCVGPSMYALTTPVAHDLALTRTPTTISGTYQAGP